MLARLHTRLDPLSRIALSGAESLSVSKSLPPGLSESTRQLKGISHEAAGRLMRNACSRGDEVLFEVLKASDSDVRTLSTARRFAVLGGRISKICMDCSPLRILELAQVLSNPSFSIDDFEAAMRAAADRSDLNNE